MPHRKRSPEFDGAGPRPLVLAIDWPIPPGGGLDRYVRDLVAALGRDREPDPVVMAVVEAGVTVPGVHAGARTGRRFPLGLVTYGWRAGRHSRSSDLIDTHFALFGLPAMAWRSARTQPLVVHFHGPWADESARDGEGTVATAAKRWVERRIYRRADRVIVLSFAFKRLLVEQFGVRPWLIDVIRPGVDLERFRLGDRSAVRARLGLDPAARVVVTTRRLVPRTGVDVLLRAWAEVARPDAVLLVVGDGPERPGLETAAGELGVRSSVRFLGRVDDDTLVLAYQAADVTVVPSRALEGFGLVVLEALACGAAMVVADIGGLPEAVAGFSEAEIVPAVDPGALSASLGRALLLAQDDEARSRRRVFAERFTWDQAATAHRALYRDVTAPGPRTGPEGLRVVYLDHTAKPSGGELALLRLLPALPSTDAHVILGESGPLGSRLALAGVSHEVRLLPERIREQRKDGVGSASPLVVLGTAAHILQLAAHLRALRPDLVHTNSLKSAIYGGLAGRLAGVPVVWGLRDRVAGDYLPAPAVAAVRLLARTIPRAVIVDSGAVAATLPDRVAVHQVPSPVPDLSSARPARRRPGPFRIVMIGRLAPWKGQDLFLDAFAMAFADGGAEAVLVGGALFGESDYAGHLARRLEGTPLAGRVRMAGHLDDVVPDLVDADALVHSSVVPEPFGLVILEAMSAGTPVVVPAAGGPAELVVDGVTGLTYPLGDVAALADRLGRLAGDPELRDRLAAAGRVAARAYLPAVIGLRTEAAYRDILAAGGRVRRRSRRRGRRAAMPAGPV